MSTEGALIEFLDQIHVDIGKALDMVDDSILLRKLFNAGFCGVSHCWFQSYLVDRKQGVKIEVLKR